MTFASKACLQMSLAITLAASAGCAAAGPAQPMTYSDLCTERQSGDIAGRRISLQPGAQGYHVRYEYTEGALMAPVESDRVQYDPADGRLTFTATTPTGEVRFVGKAGPSLLEGTLSGPGSDTTALRLKRGPGRGVGAACEAAQ